MHIVRDVLPMLEISCIAKILFIIFPPILVFIIFYS
ncbi:hypothetical protein BBUCA8_03837 [Borreliella burgdorferi CA8]|nr:hypothetical protein BBUCA8_03837 [Borreliella burgdorferi CA8]